MEMLLQRESPNGPVTRGRLSSIGVFIALSAESTALRLPVGRYQAVTHIPAVVDRSVPLLLSVIGPQAFELGQAIGLQRTEYGVCCCDEALSMVVRLIETARQRGELSYVTVIEEDKPLRPAAAEGH